MARIESVAVGGFYPTPPSLVPRIAALVSVHPDSHASSRISFLDPCAGDGAAIMNLAESITRKSGSQTWMFAAELERRRFDRLEERVKSDNVIRGDAFCIAFKPITGVDVLYLNPPYDTDRVHGRLEQRFLNRFAPAIRDGGVLLFVVPYYALAASAEFIGKQFSHVECFRFPTPEFDAFKQVVLVAKRAKPAREDGEGPEIITDVSIRDRVIQWAKSPDAIPVLPDDPEGSTFVLPPPNTSWQSPLLPWVMSVVDEATLVSEHVPWHFSSRSGDKQPIAGIVPPSGNLLARTYPTAMPPRPAHIAAGIAAGVFNGARIEPDDKRSKLPPLLVKGVFNKEYRTVEEKHDKDGDVSALVQVQQPNLVVTVLDLSSRTYHTLRMESIQSHAKTVCDFTTGDLLHHYSRSLLRTLIQHCPVMHDPANPDHAIPLPIHVKGEYEPSDPEADRVIPRQLFHAQANCVAAAVKLLGGVGVSSKRRKGKAALVLGEIGSGKSSVALATAHAINANRLLVMCPPHLLDSWRDQIKACVPWSHMRILEDVTDVDEFAMDGSPELLIAVLSRETAKLGHAVEAVTGSCPKCGAPLPKVDLAKRRARCEAEGFTPKDTRAALSVDLGLALFPMFPLTVSPLFHTAHAVKIAGIYAKHPAGERELYVDRAISVVWGLIRLLGEKEHIGYSDSPVLNVVMSLLAGLNHSKLTAEVAEHLWVGGWLDGSEHHGGSTVKHYALRAMLLLAPGSEEQKRLRLRMTTPSDAWDRVTDEADTLISDFENRANKYHSFTGIGSAGKHVKYGDHTVGDREHLKLAFKALCGMAKWDRLPPCGEALYQAVPEPRRIALAGYIAKRHRKLFDMLVLDEGHEYNTDGSAQERAAHRLTSLGIPTLALTGSVMNGYAESLFSNLWALSPAFRQEFNRDERPRFVDRYGYKKRLLEQKQDIQAEFGAVTDRVRQRAKDIGQAPGVLPLLILRHILPIAVTLHKSDLALDLPKCTEHVERVKTTGSHRAEHLQMMQALLDQIKADRWVEGRAGKLFGQMSEAPSQLDRATADTGNTPHGAFEIVYPDSVEDGGVVYAVEPMPSSTVLPKEKWMLARVKSELAEGRRVMVFTWHTELLARIARLLTEAGIRCATLDPSKVGTAKREAWIQREVIAKKMDVMLTNPVAVRTGLNPLVYFSTEIFMENPACDPVTHRQAIGRVDRIGQTKETRIYSPVYDVKTQIAMHELLMLKVAVSMSTDGLDAESALAAAGASDTPMTTGLSVGKHLYELLSEET